MKKSQQTLILFFSIIILTFFVSHAYAQVCTASYFIDGIDTSGDIAALSGCTEISGNLIIENTTLTSFTGLENITSVGQNLNIDNNDALTTLTGLNNITSLGGYLSIVYNDDLTTLSELNNLTSLGGYLWIDSNPSLTSLSGLENLTSLGGSLYIWKSDALTTLSGRSAADKQARHHRVNRRCPTGSAREGRTSG